MPDPLDDMLVERFLSGDADGFEVLYRRHSKAVYNFVRCILMDSHMAEDVLQETFTRLLGALPGYRKEGRFSAFLFRIARNAALDHLRARGNRQEVPFQGEDARSPDTAEEASNRSMLKAAISELPLDQKQVLLLREFAGLSFRDIAAVMGCPIGTALARMHRALEKLRQLLKFEEVRA